MKKFYLAIGLGAVAFGVYSYYIRQYEILSNFKGKLINIKILSSTFQQINVQLTYEVINDSSISIYVTDYDFDILINGEKVAKIKNSTINQFLKQDGGRSLFTFNTSMNTADLLQANVSLGLLEDFKNSTITIDGYFGVKKGIIKWRKIPYKYTYKVKDFL
jgi:LEA14-like dessication related protein